MRISDWSSDVCSSDLPGGDIACAFRLERGGAQGLGHGIGHRQRAHRHQLASAQCALDRAEVLLLERGRLEPRADGAAQREALSRVETRSEEHTSELQSLMRISYAVFCLKKKNTITTNEQ